MALLVTVVFAAGCSKEKESVNPANSDSASSPAVSSTASAEKVTLKVWGDLVNQAIAEEPFKKINEAFMAKHPNIKIDYEFAQNEDSLNVALQANTLPDAFYVQGNKSTKMKEMAKAGQIIPLDEYKIDSSRFPEEAINYTLVDGKMYSSLPSFFDYAMIYYNKDIFAKYSLEAPKTWDDFLKALDTLVANGVTPIAVGGNGDFDRYWPIQEMAPAFINEDMINLYEGKPIDEARMTELFDTYRMFVDKGYYGKDFVAMDGKAAQLAFTNGKTAMIFDGTWNNTIYEQASMNIGRFAMPGKDGVRYAQEGMNNLTTYAVAATSKHPKEAAEYVKFLSSLEAAQIVEDANGHVPIVKDIKPKGEIVAEFSAFDKVGKNIYHAFSAAANEKSKPQDLLLTEILPKLMLKKITGAEATQILQQELAKK
ncbi:ABC transporter substrate-binding protein [Cohnella nanjingensis]|uniref:Extracellular solute-binding protein n=1 Tax=Cohnella nanjingensis TaxID=1387779 RepID=A0A7X0VFM7_9BACL|nr:extracellular solute-binding protein [Cohnella nanjingensis]MBB6672202.1 extracellular solute-binding protein [Cohnella nanjingensis]